MMKNKENYAVAVRLDDGSIDVISHTRNKSTFRDAAQKIPIFRGVVNFVDSLVTGITTLMDSANALGIEDEETGEKEEIGKGELAGTVAFSVVVAVVVFMLLPYWLSLVFQRFVESTVALSLIEGVIRVAVFLVYIIAISRLEDINRVFMYHGAEHKCINCIEHGNVLDVEHVRASSRFHKRCGTSFLLIVMVVSIFVFACITVDSLILRMVFRVLLVPVVAGVSYEFIRFAGRSENPVINLLSRPGLCLQHLTTREPDDSMIEVGIASVEAVFDWRAFLEESFGVRTENDESRGNCD